MTLADANGFDLVISDIGLPDESGLELMRKLWGKHQLRGICISGYGMDEDVERSLEAGFVEHLTKPINFARLENAILRATRAEDTPRNSTNGEAHARRESGIFPGKAPEKQQVGKFGRVEESHDGKISRSTHNDNQG
jgi:DNA-binding NtrC family response regulator